MKYSVSEINRDWLINVERREEGRRIERRLVGVRGLVEAVGLYLANKFINRAYNATNSDVCVCKLRRGVVVSFYAH